MTLAGLRSLFRHHRQTTGVSLANPHRFRHTFASDMVRARRQPSRAHAVDGARERPDHDGVRRSPRWRFTSSTPALWPSSYGRFPGPHREPLAPRSSGTPLVPLFERAVDSLSAALCSQSARQYRGTARHFLTYLSEEYPKLRGLDQLRRDPHILGWLTHLRSHIPPLAAIT